MAYTYESVAPMASVTTPSYSYTASDAPQYQGLMGGDYDKLQEALYNPAAIAASTAYNQGMNRLSDTMGGRGLYGSSIMQNQANQGLNTVYQNTLATAGANAAAKRYELQNANLNNLNSFNKDLYGLGLTREGQINQYGLNKATNEMTQNANLWKALEQEALRKQSFYTGREDAALNQYNVDRQASTASTTGYMGAAGTALGGLLSSSGQSALGSLYNTISGWLGGGGDGGYTYGDFANEADWSDYWDNFDY